MKQFFVINPEFKKFEKELQDIISNYENKGVAFGNQKRNSLRLFKFDNFTINVKSFKKPNVFNKLVYKFFRQSKAQRSFEYANKLKALDIGTPQPIAYFEFSSILSFGNSFYLSEHWDKAFTYRDLIDDFNYPDYDTILRTFTRFTYQLHEKSINFLDHSPGNTLIKKTEKGYEFALVDLNRMRFESMDFNSRMKNFARLSKYKQMVEVMSDEYAKCYQVSYEKVFAKMWMEVQNFRNKKAKKKRLKNLFRA